VTNEDVAEDNMLKQPCRACPFRRQSLAGWLGSSTPELFVLTAFGEQKVQGGAFFIQVKTEEPLPCHLTINYEDPSWLKKWLRGWRTGNKTGSLCAGAAVMLANRVKLPRIDLPQRQADREHVFTHAHEFIDHHRSGPVHSWNEDED
jgi:hypothetical protein